MKIVLGSDHAGFDLRGVLAEYLSVDHEVVQVGALDHSSYDYPNASDAVASVLLDGSAELGVLICGTGIGVSIRANRHPHIRAALCCGKEEAVLARQHNHANVLCLGARMLSSEQALEILKTFLSTDEDKDPRHERRVEQLDRPC